MTPQQLLASANVFAGVTLVLQSDAFWVESLGVLLTAASAAYIGCAHDDYDWPCPTYNIVATERTPEDDNR